MYVFEAGCWNADDVDLMGDTLSQRENVGGCLVNRNSCFGGWVGFYS